MANNRKPPYKWMIMIYMTSNDENSEKAARKFLHELNAIGNELQKLGKAAKVKIMLLSMGNWSRPGKKKAYYTRYYEIQSGFLKKRRLTLDILNANMGDQEMLIEFILRCKEMYQAEKHLLMLWGHGTGAGMFEYQLKESKKNINHLKKVLTVIKTQKPPASEDEFFDDKFIERQIINTTDKQPTNLFYLNVSKHRELKKYLPATVRLDSLTSGEVAESLRICFGRNGSKIDVVAILGCAMQMVEFGYEIRKHCKYFVASEELMFWEGYNYKKTFLDLLKNPGMDARQLAINLVRDTVEKPAYTQKDKKEIAISCVDLELSDLLAKNIGIISNEILKLRPEIIDIVTEARIKCFHLGEKDFDSYIDVTWFLKNLARFLKDSDEYKKLLKKVEALINFLENNYIVEKYIGEGRAPGLKYSPSIGGHGVSIYYPSGKKDRYDNHLRGVPFTKASPFKVRFVNNKWNDMISAIIGSLKGNPQKWDKRL